MKKIWIIIGIVIVVALATMLIVTQTKKELEEIMIGAILPLTGVAANHGQDAKDGIIMAVAEINSAGGIEGKPVKIIFEDTRSTVEGCVSGVRKLIQVDRVPIIIGPISSSDVLAVAPIVEKARVVLFSPSASSPEISQAGDYIFRNSLLAPPQGKKMAEFCFYNLKQKTAAVFYLNDDTGRGYYEAFRNAFESLGGKVIIVDTYDREDKDFRTQIIKQKSSGAKCVYVPAIPQTMGLIIKQSAELQYYPIFLANIGVEGEDLLTIAGDLAENIFYTSVSVSEKFIENYEKTFGRTPKIAAPLAYDATKIANIAITNGGYNSIGIKDAFYSVTNFEGATGLMGSFDANGDAQRELIIKTVKNGKFVPVQQ
jgi:branched-chain amino acid transport system substrate-binding protein